MKKPKSRRNIKKIKSLCRWYTTVYFYNARQQTKWITAWINEKHGAGPKSKLKAKKICTLYCTVLHCAAPSMFNNIEHAGCMFRSSRLFSGIVRHHKEEQARYKQKRHSGDTNLNDDLLWRRTNQTKQSWNTTSDTPTQGVGDAAME